MKNFKLYLTFLLAIGLFSLNACKEEEDPVDPPAETNVTYTDDAAAILNASCAFSGCHNSGSQVGSLEGYTDAKAFAEFGRMIPAIKHEANYSPMPKNGNKLSADKIATLEQWVEDGLLE